MRDAVAVDNAPTFDAPRNRLAGRRPTPPGPCTRHTAQSDRRR